ncbi:transcription factor NIGT1-like isoform X1 [Hordeum vulgare subsp. vulgare]|uniref:transcription factor NIGT1-like isoform X1 n=1 Tax=Hordeum vulgare subsp. vulgare TaxID=112509 RepID=UPI000294BDAF|nr:transcription factor NIGT1-like isoform X1 [Hordeum vulgare subsp. vulgare]
MEVEVQADRDGARRRLRDYLLALEEERRKIHVFQRELPLCLDLVTQTIEGMKSQMGGAASEETVSDHDGPVLEEFIPLKPSLSPSSSDDETSTHAPAPVSNAKAETPPPTPTPTPETKKAMPDWLQSAQLLTWSEPQQSSSLQKVLPCRPVALNATRTGGAFHPFEKEKQPEAELPASSTTAPASSALVGDSGDKATSDTEVHDKDSKDATEKDTDKDKEGQSSQPNRKPRRCWAPELHRRFLQALQQLGGSHAVATPKQIRELMKVDGLTNDEVKSHLQKYRLHTSRRPSSTAQSSGAATTTQPAPQFFVVGSCIWVPQQEYAAAAAAAAAATDATNVAPGSANKVYAPTATLPSGVKPHSKEQSSRRSEGPMSGDTGGVNSDSDNPAMSSSSSQTTSAGHP